MSEEELLKLLKKRSPDYWAGRYDFIQARLLLKSEKEILNMRELYGVALLDLEKDLAKWYTRYATNEGISYKEAKKILKAGELSEFKLDVKQYEKLLKENDVYGGAFAKVLERASIRVHVSRLEALLMQIQEKMESLLKRESDTLMDITKNTYIAGYYQSLFELQRGVGVGVSFFALDDNLVDMVISKPWQPDGLNFSERIWGVKRPKLVSLLERELVKDLMLGKDSVELLKTLKKVFGVSQYQAERLIRTETSYFSNESFHETLKNLPIEKFQISATLDKKTCEECATLDHKIFDLKDYRTGINAPPFHANCRCTTVPYIEDFQEFGTRFARSSDGKPYSVPDTMDYTEWRKKYPGDARPEKNKK